MAVSRQLPVRAYRTDLAREAIESRSFCCPNCSHRSVTLDGCRRCPASRWLRGGAGNPTPCSLCRGSEKTRGICSLAKRPARVAVENTRNPIATALACRGDASGHDECTTAYVVAYLPPLCLQCWRKRSWRLQLRMAHVSNLTVYILLSGITPGAAARSQPRFSHYLAELPAFAYPCLARITSR